MVIAQLDRPAKSQAMCLAKTSYTCKMNDLAQSSIRTCKPGEIAISPGPLFKASGACFLKCIPNHFFNRGRILN